MKRDKKQMDDFIKRNLPSVSRKEIDDAGEQVLSRLHREMKDRIEAFELHAYEPDPEWKNREIEWKPKESQKPLSRHEYLVLRIAYTLADRAYPSSIYARVKQLVSSVSEIINASFALESLERRGYLKRGSYGFPPENPRVAQQVLHVTPSGAAALEQAERAASEAKKHELEDLA
jgi:DNA-binding MarR family transcriptional regulator